MRTYKLTQAGAAVFARATEDEPLIFTAVKYGDGNPYLDISDVEDMVSPRITLAIETVNYGLLAWKEVEGAVVHIDERPVNPNEGDYFLDTTETPYMLEQYNDGAWEELDYDPSASAAGSYKYDAATGTLYVSVVDETVILVKAKGSNAGIEAGFKVTEKGVYAKVDGDDAAVLFAYQAVTTGLENYISPASESSETYKPTIPITVGDDDNILIIQSAEYVAQSDFDDLSGDYSAFKADADERITIVEEAVADTTETVETHIGGQSNPHHVTAAQAGASALGHKHAASDVTSGTLAPERGGTGTNSIASLAAQIAPLVGSGIVVGSYIGDGKTNRTISLGFYPQAVYICPYFGFSSNYHGYGGLALRGKICRNKIGPYTDITDNGWDTSSGKIKIVQTGFVVNQAGGTYMPNMNVTGYYYYYIAIK